MNILLISKDNKIIELLKEHNVKRVIEYEEIINTTKEEYDAIILDSFSKINLIKILKNYKNKNNLRKTIIIDNIRLYSYNLSNSRYQVFTIIDNIDLEDNISFYLEEILSNKGSYNKNKSDIYQDISTILKRLGISPDKSGFHYLRKAVYECFLNPELITNMKNKLYPILEETFNTNKIDLERNMRYSIEIGFRKSEYDFTDKLFSNTLYIEQTKPKCTEFIAIVVEELLYMHNKTMY